MFDFHDHHKDDNYNGDKDKDDYWRKQKVAGKPGLCNLCISELKCSAHYHSNHYLVRNFCTQNSVKYSVYPLTSYVVWHTLL